MKHALTGLLIILSLSVDTFAQQMEASESKQPSKKAILKKALKSLSVEQRNQFISRARVFNTQDPVTEIDSSNPSTIDVIQDLQKRCGPQFQYRKSKHQDVYDWSVIECQYHPDAHSLGGATMKFLCDFKDDSKDGVKKLKVKYPNPRKGVFKSEVFASILASNVAHLLGFYTELYCPAQVVCKNCPSESPWENDRASAPAKKGQYSFPWTVVELQLPHPSMTNPTEDPNPKNSQGLAWDELRMVSAASEAEARVMRIEREAWILWINFIQETDAYAFNQRLSCVDPKMDDNQAQCPNPIAYTHDYGHAYFERFQFRDWDKSEPLKSGSDGLCRGSLSTAIYKKERKFEYKSLLLEPVISSEARDLLVLRLSRITEKQWSDIFQLSRVELETGITADKWLKTIRRKIQQLKEARCQPFESGTSVLGRP